MTDTIDCMDRVLIAGAGPVGIYTALCLARDGVPVTVLEADGYICQDMRAAGWLPPTVDILEDGGLLERMKPVSLWTDKYRFIDRVTGLDFEIPLDLVKDDVRNTIMLQCGQHMMAQLAYEMLGELGASEVLFNHEVTGITQSADHVEVTAKTPDGDRIFRGPWLIGADGGGSGVRKAAGIEFEGFTWAEKFLTMESNSVDFEPYFGLATMIADGPEWRLIIKLPVRGGGTIWRTACTAPDGMDNDLILRDDYLQERFNKLLPRDEPYEIENARIYHVHQRVAESFRRGRVILAGDAAHLNNPLGGQGLNGGIHDVANLVPKFLRVWRGEAGDELLDLYDRQRRLTNIKYIQATSMENKKRIDESDDDAHRERMKMMAVVGKNPEAGRKFLRRFLMIDGLEESYTIE